jgi:hypothetical protein
MFLWDYVLIIKRINAFALSSSRHETVYANVNSFIGTAMQNTKAVMKSKNVHSREKKYTFKVSNLCDPSKQYWIAPFINKFHLYTDFLSNTFHLTN